MKKIIAWNIVGLLFGLIIVFWGARKLDNEFNAQYIRGYNDCMVDEYIPAILTGEETPSKKPNSSLIEKFKG